MAKDFRFELNYAGVGELLKSKEMARVLAEHGHTVLGRLPHGYGMSEGETTQRAKVTVGTRTRQAESDNKKNNTLLKALGGG